MEMKPVDKPREYIPRGRDVVLREYRECIEKLTDYAHSAWEIDLEALKDAAEAAALKIDRKYGKQPEGIREIALMKELREFKREWDDIDGDWDDMDED